MTRLRPAAAILALAVVAAGCGGSRSISKEELDKAQTAVQAGLDAWKNKQTAKALQTRSPAIEMSDPDWTRGAVLLDYQIKRTEGTVGENIRCWVSLSCADRKSKKTERDVVYEVKVVGEKIVIGRDAFN